MGWNLEVMVPFLSDFDAPNQHFMLPNPLFIVKEKFIKFHVLSC